MSVWIDKKYISIFGTTARNFKWKSGTLANCSCPLCGDSSQNKLKARLYFFEKEAKYFIFCHNCGASTSLRNFLKQINPSLYDEYSKETFIESNKEKSNNSNQEVKISIQNPKFLERGGILSGLKRISQLKVNHPAKKYIDNRKIPHNLHYKLFYAPKFKQWVNTIVPNKFKDLNSDEPRLVIPLLDENKNAFGIQGRSFFKSEPKYYTIIFDETKPKIFGLDTVDFNREYFIVEGPIDSLFINNCLAMVGSDFSSVETLLPNINTNAVIIYDNEPRNKQITDKIEKTIKKGFKVVLWPNNIIEKDINDMIINGMTCNDIRFVIKTNIFSGLEAMLKFQLWSKS